LSIIKKIPLDGNLTDVELKKINLENIILDVDNPRIQYYLDTRLSNDISLDEIKLALAESNDQYERLKGHIERNGGIFNPIWVVTEGAFYRVIEGNTRALIYSELSEKYIHEEKWKFIEAYILPSAVDRHKINFVRLEAHLFGATPWDAYEKARELWRLYNEEYYSVKRLEQLTKLKAYDIMNNIQAFKDMEEQYLPKYKRPGEQLKFSYFAEFRKNKELKRLVNEGTLTLRDFCDLVGTGKFGRGEHVRKLAMVWKDEDARNVLIEDNMEDALEQLAQKNPAAKSKLFEKIKDVSFGLENMPFAELNEIKRGLQIAKVKELKRLHNVVKNLLADIGHLSDG
jgi:hypothetical protein